MTCRHGDGPGRSAGFDCHRGDDMHEGRLGTDCATCHNPNDRALWIFDHDNQTGFPLAGRRAGVQCRACHQAPGASLALTTACSDCHAAEDVHRGQFGTGCGSCHDATDWKRVTLRF